MKHALARTRAAIVAIFETSSIFVCYSRFMEPPCQADLQALLAREAIREAIRDCHGAYQGAAQGFMAQALPRLRRCAAGEWSRRGVPGARRGAANRRRLGGAMKPQRSDT
ncbi:MAG: hypothetical protein KGM91_01140 [Burkholderiales bacterium]|nr:hypothetical protein [Burkholderiales bacterium]